MALSISSLSTRPDVAETYVSPQYAAAGWQQCIQPFTDDTALGGPAVSNNDTGLPWLAEFSACCEGCQINFVPFH